MSAAKLKRLEINLDKLQKSYANLLRGLERQRDEEFYEILSNRFRLSFEVIWRLARRVMIAHKVDFEFNTMRELVEKAQEIGLFPVSLLWLKMQTDHNILTHEYDEPDLKNICKKIEQQYVSVLNIAVENLTNATNKIISQGA